MSPAWARTHALRAKTRTVAGRERSASNEPCEAAATCHRGHPGRGTVQAGPGVRGRSPCHQTENRRQANPFSKRSVGPAPKGARSQPGGRSRNGAWGNWTQARQPAQRGAAGAACGQGGNAPGCKDPPGVRERARRHAEGAGQSNCGEAKTALRLDWPLTSDD
jgi:hypothetical protein